MNSGKPYDHSALSDSRQRKQEQRIKELEENLQRKHEVLSELIEEACAVKKISWGDLKGCWVAHDVRDALVDFVKCWSRKAEISASHFLVWLGLPASKYYAWQARYGKANEHNGLVPRDFWLERWEQEAIIAFHDGHPLEGYRRLTFMMLDADVVAVSPSSTYRVLRQASLLQRRNRKKSAKGTGFQQPLTAHVHWHIDVSHVNIRGTFSIYAVCWMGTAGTSFAGSCGNGDRDRCRDHSAASPGAISRREAADHLR